MDKILIGSHIGMGKPDYLLGSVEEAFENNENCFMVYTGSPQTFLRTPLEKLKISEAWKLMEENNIKRENIVIHAPYLINGAKSEKFSFSKKLLDSEINRTKQMGFKMIVLHPGSNENKQQGIKDLIYFINEVNKTNDDVIICLETMSGKGNEIGVNLNELKEIFDGINKKNMIGFCLDTCHMHDSGIEIAYFSDYLDQFDKMIGLEYIKCLHINDSLNELGSHKDRHANLGYGKIGFDNLINVIYNEKLINVPKILETPWIDEDHSPYKKEIEMIKDKKFEDWIK